MFTVLERQKSMVAKPGRSTPDGYVTVVKSILPYRICALQAAELENGG